MKICNKHIGTIWKTYVFVFVFLIGFNAHGQQDSLILYSKNIRLGMTGSDIDSLMTFHVAKMNKAGGKWRNLYDNVYQITTDYQDKQWKYYTFRMLFQMDTLFYVDLYVYRSEEVLYSLKDSIKVNQLVNNFNKKYKSSEKFSSILKAFSTMVYDLGNPLDKFFSNASVKDKKRLLAYSKSLCPEYFASAIIRILELEKHKPFLNANEKLTLKEIMDSEIQIHFMIGCVYRLHTFSQFLNQYHTELKGVIK